MYSSPNAHLIIPLSSSSPPSLSSSFTSTNLQLFDENISSTNYLFVEPTKDHLLIFALNLKSLLQDLLLEHSFPHRSRSMERLPTKRNRSSSSLSTTSETFSNTSFDSNSQNKVEGKTNKKIYREAEGEGEGQAEEGLQEEESSDSSIYEIAVIKYRLLRNEMPLLSDAAHDIDAINYALQTITSPTHTHTPNSSSFTFPDRRTEKKIIQIGPSVKRALPGRGRRKTLSVIHTPLPVVVLESIKKQKKTTNYCLSTSEASHLLLPRRLRILFIDSSLVTLRLASKRFQDAGFWMETISTGAEALVLLIKGETEYDIVLTDINMPTMSGNEVLVTPLI
jgi:hypothetical protein